MRRLKSLSLLFTTLLLLSACASTFTTPSNSAFKSEVDTLNGTEIFTQSFLAHGGAKLAELRNVNVGLTGKWKQLIRRIQPLVTDFSYRVESQERILPNERIYAAHYNGPAGSKRVFRSPSSVSVNYNGASSSDSAVLSSTALTADSFHLFLLGPLALEPWRHQATRLSDKTINKKPHWRIHINRAPGFGFSKLDNVVLWIDPISKRTSRVQITLEGHDTTKGAHVEVDFLAYQTIQDYVFPSVFFERVKAPIAIDAHAWHLTGLDINRDYTIADISNGLKNKASEPADSSLFK